MMLQANPASFNEHANVAHKGGSIAKTARLNLEEEIGKDVVAPTNVKQGILSKNDPKK